MGEIVFAILRYLLVDGLIEKICLPLVGIFESVAINPDNVIKVFTENESIYDVMQGIGMGLLTVNAMWQAFKSMFVGLGLEADEPVKIAVKTFVAGFLMFYIKDILFLVVKLTGQIGNQIIVNIDRNQSISAAFKALFTSGGIYLIVSLIIFFMCLGLLMRMFERLVLCALLIVFCPIAVACMIAKTTEGFWQGFMKMFIGNVVIQIIQTACFIMVQFAVFNFTKDATIFDGLIATATGEQYDGVVVNGIFNTFLIFAIMGISKKLEDIIRDISISVGVNRDMQGALSKIGGTAYSISMITSLAGGARRFGG